VTDAVAVSQGPTANDHRLELARIPKNAPNAYIGSYGVRRRLYATGSSAPADTGPFPADTGPFDGCWGSADRGHDETRGQEDVMAELNDIYSTRLLDIAANIVRTERLANPDVTATAHSKLCGSTIIVDLCFDGDTIVDYGQTVKACLLGQASASIVGREIIGVTADEIQAIGRTMRAMLKEDGPPPEGHWADLALLEPVRPYKSRHASTLLVFEAIDKAIAAHREGRSTVSASSAAANA
jgi:NifU-like protein involved in Fe-S cluster formation